MLSVPARSVEGMENTVHTPPLLHAHRQDDDSRLSDVQGLSAQDAEAVDVTVRTTREAFAAPVSLETRLKRLSRLEAAVRTWEPQLLEALAQDLGKSAAEAWSTELGPVLSEIRHVRRLLPSWVTPTKVPGTVALAPSTAWIDHQPLGTVLIIAPWNYPVQLVLLPLVGALAAGNTAVIKPSEVTPHVAAVLERAVAQHLSDCVGVVTGGVPETTRVLQHRFDHIFYTGNAAVGRVVMRAAAEYLTPVTLELGGKSPVWVDDTVDLATTAQRLAWAKFLNAGQTCVAPDYVMGTSEVLRRLEPLLVAAIRRMYGPDPDCSDSYGRIVSKKHLTALTEKLDQVPADDVVCGGTSDPSQCYLAPTVIRQRLDGPLMQQEIFGPVLPLVSVANDQEAIAYINGGDKPLALYVFSQDDHIRQAFRSATSSGGMCMGAAVIHLAHPHLPFGGVGNSGMGSYHGEHSLKTFSHERAVVDKPLKPDTLAMIYPPYTALRSAVTKIAMGAPSPVKAVQKFFGSRATRP